MSLPKPVDNSSFEDQAPVHPDLNYKQTLARLKANLKLPKSFTSMSNVSVQKECAPLLRAFVIDYLGNKTIKTPVTMGFRGEYLPQIMGEHYTAFLKAQAKDKAWGTYIEATALGEAFNCTVYATPITQKGTQQKPICLYYAGPQAPVIHLFNQGNTHWSTHKNNTIGDGNCLYNAFAQALQGIAVSEQIKAHPSTALSFYTQQQHQAQKTHAHIVKAQQLIHNDLKTPFFQTSEQIQQEAERISRLPQHIQEQIVKDYIYALELAKEESSYIHHNMYHYAQDDECLNHAVKIY